MVIDVYVRYSSVIDKQNYIVRSFFNNLYSVPDTLQVGEASVDDILIHLGCSLKNHNSCMFEIGEVGEGLNVT